MHHFFSIGDPRKLAVGLPLLCQNLASAVLGLYVLLSLLVPAIAAETAVKAGAGITYKYDDNIQVSPENQISLSGWVMDGSVNARYSTARFEASAYVKLGIERYDDVDLDTNNPLLKEPKTSDFDNESADVTTNVSYDWERHNLALQASYLRDSTLNTTFLDTGLGGIRELEGATRIERTTLRPAWQWQLTERQTLDSQLQWQRAEYQSNRYIDYDYASATFNWTYAWNERFSVQLQPNFSRYENKAASSVESDTVGLQGGFIWAIKEKWRLNLLAGASQVSTEYDSEGFFVFNPETGLVELVEIEDQDSNAFTGDATLTFDEEYYGFSANVSSRYAPTGNGTLRQNSQGRLRFYWKPRQRMRVDIDAVIGREESSDDRIDNKRDFSQAGVRFGYQFAEDWWLSASYRYRTQEASRPLLVQDQAKATGNTVSVGVSYRLPEEIL
jgi:hypothetical protein